MPYASNRQLPKAQTDQYSGHQKTAFRKAFDSALHEYGNEAEAFAVAHAAAKKTPRQKPAIRLRKKAGGR